MQYLQVVCRDSFKVGDIWIVSVFAGMLEMDILWELSLNLDPVIPIKEEFVCLTIIFIFCPRAIVNILDGIAVYKLKPIVCEHAMLYR